MVEIQTATLQTILMMVALGYAAYVMAAPGYLGRISGIGGMLPWSVANAVVALIALLGLLGITQALPAATSLSSIWVPAVLWLFAETTRRMLGYEPMTMRRRAALVILFGINLMVGLGLPLAGRITGLLLALAAVVQLARWLRLERQRLHTPNRLMLVALCAVPCILLLASLVARLGGIDVRIRYMPQVQLATLVLVVFINMSVMYLGFSLFARQLRTEGTRDPLVGILNRRGIVSEAQSMLLSASVDKLSLAVLMLDMDHFSKINERAPHFHDGGDVVLRQAAERMDKALKHAGGLVGRYGGEEFLGLAIVKDSQTAMDIAERIRHAIAATPIVYHNESYAVTCSIGVCYSTYRHARLTRLIELADQALYQAKASGRNRCVMVMTA